MAKALCLALALTLLVGCVDVLAATPAPTTTDELCAPQMNACRGDATGTCGACFGEEHKIAYDYEANKCSDATVLQFMADTYFSTAACKQSSLTAGTLLNNVALCYFPSYSNQCKFNMARAVKVDTFSVATTTVAVSSTLNGVSLADFTDPVQQAFECAIATAAATNCSAVAITNVTASTAAPAPARTLVAASVAVNYEMRGFTVAADAAAATTAVQALDAAAMNTLMSDQITAMQAADSSLDITAPTISAMTTSEATVTAVPAATSMPTAAPTPSPTTPKPTTAGAAAAARGSVLAAAVAAAAAAALFL